NAGRGNGPGATPSSGHHGWSATPPKRWHGLRRISANQATELCAATRAALSSAIPPQEIRQCSLPPISATSSPTSPPSICNRTPAAPASGGVAGSPAITLGVYGHLFKRMIERRRLWRRRSRRGREHRDSTAPRLARYGMIIGPYCLGVGRALPYACVGKGYQIDVFIGAKPERTFYPKGTGFIVVYEEFGLTFPHLVTAKHVIALLRDMGAIDPWIRVNTSDGYAKEFEAPYSYWTFHPSDDTTDVAVCPFNMHVADFDVTWVPLKEMAATRGVIQ